jgi:hypothetical protein
MWSVGALMDAKAAVALLILLVTLMIFYGDRHS